MKKTMLIKERLLKEGYFQEEKEIVSWIMMGRIFCGNNKIYSPAEKVDVNAEIRIKKYHNHFTSKGGVKLQGALDFFNVSPLECVSFDCGASTGGFTDCLLKNGAKLVYAVDVGYDQLLSTLKNSNKVINMEKTNISDEILLNLNPKPTFATIDVSYLSLKILIPILQNILDESSNAIILVKPIFEIESKDVRRTGDINHPEYFLEILTDLFDFIENNTNFKVMGITHSTVLGNSGTVEFFLHITNNKNIGKTDMNIINKQIKLSIDRGMNLPKYGN